VLSVFISSVRLAGRVIPHLRLVPPNIFDCFRLFIDSCASPTLVFARYVRFRLDAASNLYSHFDLARYMQRDPTGTPCLLSRRVFEDLLRPLDSGFVSGSYERTPSLPDFRLDISFARM